MDLDENKKVVVFGGSGFIGSHVADLLSEMGYDVTIFDVKESAYLRPDQNMVVGDILDFDLVRKTLDNVKVVYNFAGIADIEEAENNPIGTIKINILGNAHILESLKDQEIERYIFASSVYVHSDSGSFYKDSKVACEMYINDYNKKYGIPFTILRYGSLYGPRTNMKDRIYKMVKQAITDNQIIYEGNGEEVREYIHVEDAARCSVEILDKPCLNENILITGPQDMKIKDVMIMINEILGENRDIKLLNENSELHYNITPYSFHPRLGKKYISDYYIDMGQGIIQCIEEVYQSLNNVE